MDGFQIHERGLTDCGEQLQPSTLYPPKFARHEETNARERFLYERRKKLYCCA